MGIKEILEKIVGSEGKPEARDYEDFVKVQLEYASGEEVPEREVVVHRLRGFSEIDTCISHVSDGNIVIVDIRPLANRNMRELKQAVDEMKEICASMHADLAGLGDSHLIITPKGIRIQKSKPTEFEESLERVRSKA